MIIDELLISLGFKLDKKSVKDLQTFEQGFKKATTNLLKMTAAAVAGSTALVAFTKVMSESTDELAKSSRKLGIEAQELDSLRFAMNLVTGSGAGVNGMLEAFGQNLSQLQRGEGPTLAFNRLGLDNASTDINDILGALDQAIEGASKLDTFEAQEMLGAMGLGGFALAAENLPAFREAVALAKDLSFISKEDTAAAELFNDQWVGLTRVIREFSVLLSSSLSPFLSEAIEGFRDWMVINKEFLRSEVGAVFETLGRVLKTVAGFLGRMADHAVDFIKLTKSIGGLNTALKITLGVFSLIAAMQFGLMIKNLTFWVGKLAVKFGVLNFMAALPVVTIAALVALVILLGDEIATALRGGRTLFKDLYKEFPILKGFVEDATANFILLGEKMGKIANDPLNKKNWEDLFTFIGDKGKESFEALKSMLKDWVGIDLDSSNWTDYFSDIKSGFKALIEPVEEALKRIGVISRPAPGSSGKPLTFMDIARGASVVPTSKAPPIKAPTFMDIARGKITVEITGATARGLDSKALGEAIGDKLNNGLKQADRNLNSGNAK